METTQVCAVRSPVVASQVGASSDCYVSSGRVGRINLNTACYSFFEVLQLVAHDLVANGEAAAVVTMLRARVKTVRQFLREHYGIFTGPREYWHSSRFTADEADCRDFLRILRRS